MRLWKPSSPGRDKGIVSFEEKKPRGKLAISRYLLISWPFLLQGRVIYSLHWAPQSLEQVSVAQYHFYSHYLHTSLLPSWLIAPCDSFIHQGSPILGV